MCLCCRGLPNTPAEDTLLFLACRNSHGFSNERFAVGEPFIHVMLHTTCKFFCLIIFCTKFACPLQIRVLHFDELFPYGTADSIVSPIFSKFGGLRWMGSLSSAFLLAPTVSFSISTWVGPIGAWVVAFVQPSTCTGGMSRPHGSSSQPLMSNKRHLSIICIYMNKEAGSFTMLVILSYQALMSP